MAKTVNGAEAVILSLLEENVETIFGYIGGAIMPVYDALYGYTDKLRHIMTRHEQGAIHAAQAYARVKRKPGVCFATSGPGATNLTTGLADAMIDSTPLVCITGQVTSSLLGMDAFQETDVVGLSMPITKWNFQITSPDEITEAIAKAFYIASTGRPGPVLLDITKDAQFGKVDYEYSKCKGIRSYFPYPKASINDIEAGARLINDAKKPFLLIGQGVTLSGAQDEILKLVETTDMPVGSTLLGLSAFPSKHENFAGMLGMHGNYAPNILTNESDLLVAIGMRFDDRVTSDVAKYAPQAKIVHIDIDSAEIGKIVKPTVAIKSDAKTALTELLPMLKKQSRTEWKGCFKELYRKEYDVIIKKQTESLEGKLRMGEVVKRVSDATKGSAIVVTDVGQQQMTTARYYQFEKSNSFISSGGLGTMGFGIPAAMGAKIASPDRTVVAFIGDGGFQMTIQELQTISELKIPVKLVLLNNNFLGMVRQWQELFFEKRYSFTEMTTPDFMLLAQGFRIQAAKVEKREDLDAAIEKMLAEQGPFLLECVVEREDNVFPMIAPGESISNMKLE